MTVDMHEDGSGTVRVAVSLDAAAVQAAEAGGGKLEDRIRLTDLGAAGWTVGAWARRKDGGATIVLTKPFSSPGQVAGILDEVSGTVGPLRGVHATRDRGALSTRTGVSGEIDLSKLQTGITADPALVQNLTGQQIDVAALDQSLTQQLQGSVHVKFVAELPGGTTTFVGAAGTRVPIDASASMVDWRRIGLLVLAAALLAGALAVLLGGRARRRRGDRGRTAGARTSDRPPPPMRTRVSPPRT